MVLRDLGPCVCDPLHGFGCHPGGGPCAKDGCGCRGYWPSIYVDIYAPGARAR